MKSTLYLITLLAGFLLTISSCKKDADQVPPETIDSLKSVLPKQIILQEEGSEAEVVSIKYDTLNHKIELYEDDTTNSNPYDKLAVSFSFNNDGYLINYIVNTSGLDNDFENTTININRKADNKINYIAYDDSDYDERDTTFYTYQSESSGTKITTNGIAGYFEGSTIYRYDNNYNLLEYQGEYANATFQYNPNNSISKMVGSGIGDNVADFSYSSGIPDDKEDLLCRLLIGKDYYLSDLKELYPFNFYLDPDYDNYMISATNPYHLTRMKDTHQPDAAPTGIEEATMAYELNDQQLLSKVTFVTEAVGQFPAYTETIKIKY